MPDTNGTGRSASKTVLGARRRVNAVPKTIEFEIETVNDGVQILKGYCKGRSEGYGPCPTSVTIEVGAAFDLWRDKVYLPVTVEEQAAWDAYVVACEDKGEEPGACPIHEDGTMYHGSQEATLTLHRDLLKAVIPGLDPATADVLAGEDGDWEAMLVDLGWYNPTPVAEIAAPEVAGEESPSTGVDSSPASAASTASAPPTS